MSKKDWLVNIKVLVVSCIIATIGNAIYSAKAGDPVSVVEGIPGMLLLLLISLGGLAIWAAVNKNHAKHNMPAIAYISLLAMVMTIPGFPGAEFTYASINKIGLLPLCTPILAYAGISVGKDLDTFKQQGVAIVLVSLFAFVGTYIGSAIIAQIVLSIMGVI